MNNFGLNQVYTNQMKITHPKTSQYSSQMSTNAHNKNALNQANPLSTHKSFKNLLLMALLCVMALVLASCSANTTESTTSLTDTESINNAIQRTEHLVIGIVDTESNFDFLSEQYTFANLLYPLFYQSLEDLTEEQIFSDDQKNLTLILKKGITFTDGSTLDSSHIKSNLDSAISRGGGIFKPEISNIEEITIEGEHTLTIHFKNPMSAFIPELYIAKNPDPFKIDWSKPTDEILSKIPLGTGEYKVNAILEGSKTLVLKAKHSKKYNVISIITATTETDIAEFEKGNIDILELPLSREYLNRAKKYEFGYIFNSPNNNTYHLGISHLSKLSNPDLRKALAHALDKNKIISSVWAGFYEKLDLPIIYGVNSDVGEYFTEFDLEKTSKLLDASGYLRPSDALQRYLDDTPLSLTLGVISDASWAYNIAPILKQSFAQLGIDLKFDYDDFDSLLAKSQNGTVDIFTFAFNLGDTHSDLVNLFTTNGIYNYFGITDPELDSILNSTDLNMESFLGFHQDKVLILPIARGVSVFAINDRFTQSKDLSIAKQILLYE